MPPYMDDNLRAVGRWIDDRVDNQSAASQAQLADRKAQSPDSPAELCLQKSRSSRTSHTGSSRGSHCYRVSMDCLLDAPPQVAIKQVRAVQSIRRQHPACFVRAEEGQQGNEATSKPPGRRSRAELELMNRASVYLPLDEHEVDK
ncbi:hypothetical protein F4808DRAFT_456651 [Astrocystis sublimbata]|nr:hypothetical protein F4808DRAFT_456651 [Astrocystis sublimbata]